MTAVLDRLPPFATTGIGSLPFGEPATAARHAVGAYELPFCPQLPRLDGDMIEEWLGADPGACGWSADRDRERPAAWDAFVRELDARLPRHRLVKLQVTGPVTLAVALEQAAGRIGAGAGVAALAGEIAVWLAANSADQVRVLRERGLDAILVADEPGLARAGLEPRDAVVWDPLRQVAGAWGLHVCGRVPWRTVEGLEPDLFSFDLARYGLEPEAVRVLGALVRRGGRVALGILDAADPGRTATAAARAAVAVESLSGEGVPVESGAARSLLTPACGTGRLSTRRERLVAATLAAAADAVEGAVTASTRPGGPGASAPKESAARSQPETVGAGPREEAESADRARDRQQ